MPRYAASLRHADAYATIADATRQRLPPMIACQRCRYELLRCRDAAMLPTLVRFTMLAATLTPLFAAAFSATHFFFFFCFSPMSLFVFAAVISSCQHRFATMSFRRLMPIATTTAGAHGESRHYAARH